MAFRKEIGAFLGTVSELPLIEKLGVLSTLESAVDVEAGLIFTLANFLLALGPTLFTLQICGFVPIPAGPAVVPELVVVLGTLVAGLAAWTLALIVSLLQDDDQQGLKVFR